MLHLFNKVYLEFDNKIEINYDRVVISKQFGIPMSVELDKVAYGKLISYGKSLDDLLNGEHINSLIRTIKDYSDVTNKKVIIYCDKDNFIKIFTKWHKLITPSMDAQSFQKLYDLTIYKERVITNTQLGSVTALASNPLWTANQDVSSYWAQETKSTTDQRTVFDEMGLSLSYEYLLANYLSGSNHYLNELRVTIHMFLRRFFIETFTDNRMMVLLNILNYRFQEVMDIDPSTIKYNSENPLDGIPGLEFYADTSIWDKSSVVKGGVYGVCNLDGITQQQVNGLRNTLLKVYDRYEGMQIDRNVFTFVQFIEYVVKAQITTEELNTVLDAVVNHPFDTCLVPRFDFQNVNFPLILYILDLKKKNNINQLKKFALV